MEMDFNFIESVLYSYSSVPLLILKYAVILPHCHNIVVGGFMMEMMYFSTAEIEGSLELLTFFSQKYSPEMSDAEISTTVTPTILINEYTAYPIMKAEVVTRVY